MACLSWRAWVPLEGAKTVFAVSAVWVFIISVFYVTNNGLNPRLVARSQHDARALQQESANVDNSLRWFNFKASASGDAKSPRPTQAGSANLAGVTGSLRPTEAESAEVRRTTGSNRPTASESANLSSGIGSPRSTEAVSANPRSTTVSHRLTKADSGQGQQVKNCVHPKLLEDDPVMEGFLKKLDPPKCEDEEWLYVENGTVKFSKTALAKHKHLTCDYHPLVRKGDYAYNYATPIRNIRDGFKMVSDFFKGVCRDDEKNVTNTGLYSGVHHSKERAQRSDGADPLKSGLEGLSIAILGFDSMSRMSWHRRLKDTRAYFRDVLSGIELESHNIVGDGTTAVMLPMLTGKFEWELPECRVNHKSATTLDKFPFIWHDLKKKGYLTSWCNAKPRSAVFNWRMRGFNEAPTDFYTRPYYTALKQEIQSQVKYCIKSRTESHVWLDYFRDVFLMYSHQRKFLFHFITEFSHDDNNLITMMDSDIKNLVHFLYDGNYLNNTVFILMGDHGARYASYANFRSTYSGKMEERLPYFGFLFPPWFEKKYPQAMGNLRTNTQRLTTPFDIHETFRDFLHFGGAGRGDIRHRGISLFKEIPLSRSCKDADIAPHWCACLDWKDASMDDPQVKAALKAAIDTINGYTAPYRDDCALLVLANVTTASKLEAKEEFLKFKDTDKEGGIYRIDMTNNNKNEITLYQLTFYTSPGGGNFEVTVTYNDNLKEFLLSENEISRTNKYGSDPACILEKNKQIQAYCYCKSNLNGSPHL